MTIKHSEILTEIFHSTLKSEIDHLTSIWLQITLERGKHGYGFSVVEECPVKVGRVDGASPAENAGLLPGDCIVKVNGQNVSRSQAGSVAKLVK